MISLKKEESAIHGRSIKLDIMDLKKVIIETDRLILKPLEEKYAEVIFKEFSPKVTKYMYPKSPDRIDETYAYIKSTRKELEDGCNLPMIILKKDNSEFIGGIGLQGIGQKDPELGIWTKEDSQGNGFGLEAMTALIQWAKVNMKHSYLKYPVDKRNIASRRIPEKNNGKIMLKYKKINQIGFELDEYEYWI